MKHRGWDRVEVRLADIHYIESVTVGNDFSSLEKSGISSPNYKVFAFNRANYIVKNDILVYALHSKWRKLRVEIAIFQFIEIHKLQTSLYDPLNQYFPAENIGSSHDFCVRTFFLLFLGIVWSFRLFVHRLHPNEISNDFYRSQLVYYQKRLPRM